MRTVDMLDQEAVLRGPGRDTEVRIKFPEQGDDYPVRYGTWRTDAVHIQRRECEQGYVPRTNRELLGPWFCCGEPDNPHWRRDMLRGWFSRNGDWPTAPNPSAVWIQLSMLSYMFSLFPHLDTPAMELGDVPELNMGDLIARFGQPWYA